MAFSVNALPIKDCFFIGIRVWGFQISRAVYWRCAVLVVSTVDPLSAAKRVVKEALRQAFTGTTCRRTHRIKMGQGGNRSFVAFTINCLSARGLAVDHFYEGFVSGALERGRPHFFEQACINRRRRYFFHPLGTYDNLNGHSQPPFLGFFGIGTEKSALGLTVLYCDAQEQEQALVWCSKCVTA